MTGTCGSSSLEPLLPPRPCIAVSGKEPGCGGAAAEPGVLFPAAPAAPGLVLPFLQHQKHLLPGKAGPRINSWRRRSSLSWRRALQLRPNAELVVPWHDGTGPSSSPLKVSVLPRPGCSLGPALRLGSSRLFSRTPMSQAGSLQTSRAGVSVSKKNTELEVPYVEFLWVSFLKKLSL